MDDMDSTTGSAADPSKAQRVWMAAAALLLCLLLLFRFQLLNGFTILQGDRFDGVIVSVIMEHWFRVLTQGANWLDVGYFFPYTRTIAQTDGYFLIGLAYLPFRLFGLDPFLATDLSSLVIKATGFVGMYALCRRAVGLSFYWAVLAAILFTISNGMTIHSWRIQLATVALAPVLALFSWHATTALLAGDSSRFRRWGMGAGLLFGAWCLTCFYMAWFFVFFVTALIAVLLTMSGRASRAILRTRLVEQYRSVMVVVTVAALALLPFLYAFLPKSREVGLRSYFEVVPYLVAPTGVMQVGQNNLLQGPLYNRLLSFLSLNGPPTSEYSNTGFTVVLFCLFAAGCMHFLKSPSARSSANLLLRAVTVATLVTWLLALDIGGYSGWFLIYQAFPGAKALRVVSTFQIFLAMPVVLIAVSFLARIKKGLVLTLPLVGLLIASEINEPYLAFDRARELRRMALPQAIPDSCKVFYVAGLSQSEEVDEMGAIYAHNVVAMYIARQIGIPTVNGIASFNPPDWNFKYPNQPDYDSRVLDYAAHRDLTGLCRLDLPSKRWSLASVPVLPSMSDAVITNFDPQVVPDQIKSTKGLAARDDWGTWSDDDQVRIEFSKKLPAQVKIRIVGQAFGPNVGKTFVAHVGDSSVDFTLGATPETKTLVFSNPSRSTLLTIDIPKPTSPKELEQGLDERKLGLGIIQMSIVTQ